ncbi:MAG TPA: type II secretion system protein GspL [Steroidobacteraceae bacterium]|jgi:general secretion pathway protein L|nr:type II secretion system protein GspL [Steroidobacteraceae bacterium]
MPEFLVVRLPSGAAATIGAAAEWIVMDGTGARRGNVQSGPLDLAPAAAANRKVVVLVPGTDALLAEPVLPVKSGVKLAQVVPFALEEHLASDVEDLHFAVGKRDVRPGTPVTVVARARMDAWQALLTDAGLQADAIYPETAALPETPNAITLLIDGARVYVRRPETPGTVLDVQPLIEALQLALASGEEAREHVTIYVAEDDYERERELLEGLREFTQSLQLKLLPDGPLPLLAAHIVQHPGVNLMQGAYQSKRRLNVSFAPWRYAAVLAGVFLVAHLGLKSWQYFHYRSQEARLDAEIANVYQQLMPGAPMPEASAARRMVEARLNQLRGSGPVSGVMTTLAALGEALGQTPDVTIENIAYVNNTTNLRVLAPDTAALDRIRQLASEHGLESELKSDSTRDQKHEGQLQFKNPGA